MKDIIQQYLGCLESGDLEKMGNLFSGDAVIHSPLYGDMPAKEFFKGLFADTNQSKISLLDIFSNAGRQSYAAHFRYHWILNNGNSTSFECVDIFQFDGLGKIKEMTIIYDTYKIRDGFKNK